MPYTSTTAAPLHYTDRPDRTAVQALQDAYARMTSGRLHHGRRAWTAEEMRELGTLYVSAWRTIPAPSRLKAQWCMPDAASVVRTFGSYTAFYAALEEPAPCI
jgi:hypothetical protein